MTTSPLACRFLALFILGFVLTVADAQGDQISADQFMLPGEAAYPEGIAYDSRTGDFYVGSTQSGTVYRGNVPGELEVFLQGGQDGRTSVTGMKVDSQGRLFVAGRNTGRAFVYDTASGALLKALSISPASRTLINDVVVTEDAAYFTDSFRPIIFRVPLTPDRAGELETWLELEGTPVPHGGGFTLTGSPPPPTSATW